MKTKTFKEVVRDIKKGETWVTTDKRYKLKSITWEEDSRGLAFNYSDSTRNFFIDPNQEFVLDRKLYSFDKAYIELLNGRVIESESGNMFVMKDGEIDRIEKTDISICSNIGSTDILGKWYVYTER